jgi:hypothetical protein
VSRELASAPELTADAHVAACLQRFAQGDSGDAASLPWVSRLSLREQGWLRSDLALVLAEPESTGEPLDWHELQEILREAAVLAGWEGPLLLPPPPAAPARAYVVDLRPDDLRALETAPPAVQHALRDLRERFLPTHPTSAARLERGRLKKLANRDIWQIDLPDGYRLRYFVAEPERTVYVVYLGPHPDGAAAGREQSIRARVQRQRHGG